MVLYQEVFKMSYKNYVSYSSSLYNTGTFRRIWLLNCFFGITFLFLAFGENKGTNFTLPENQSGFKSATESRI